MGKIATPSSGIDINQNLTTKSFKERYVDFQHMVQELLNIRNNNLSNTLDLVDIKIIPPNLKDPPILFSEVSLIFASLERFLRMVLNDKANEKDTLYNLLEKAISMNFIHLIWENQNDGIRWICNVRNAFLHGNFEQLAQNSGHFVILDYFQKTFARQIEIMYHIVDDIIGQIDLETGKPL